MIALAPLVFTLVYFRFYVPALIAALIILGLTRLPDWDMHLAGVRHRGITHTLTFAIGMGILVGVCLTVLISGMSDSLQQLTNAVPDLLSPHVPTPSLLEAFGFGFLTGCVAILAHLFGDIITPTGIRPFLPFDDTRYRYSVTRASDPLANIMLFLAGTGMLISAFVLGLVLNGTLTT